MMRDLSTSLFNDVTLCLAPKAFCEVQILLLAHITTIAINVVFTQRGGKNQNDQ